MTNSRSRKRLRLKQRAQAKRRDHNKRKANRRAAPIIDLKTGKPRRFRLNTMRSEFEPAPIGGRWLGDEKIYRPMVLAADQVMRQFEINESAMTEAMKLTPVVVFQPQGGKHGAGDEVADRFIDKCVERSRPGDPCYFQIIVMSGLTNLSNKQQAKDRTVDDARLAAKAHLTGLARYNAKDKGIQQGIQLLNCSQAMQRHDYNDPAVKVRLWILDEAHIANIAGGCISSLLMRHGVFMSRPVQEWGNETGTINLVMLMSATAYAHELKGDKILGLKGDPDFHIIYEPPELGYNSLAIMRESGRLRQTQPLPKRASSKGPFRDTEFFETMYADFLERCKKRGPGYLVIRATGKQHQQLTAYLSREKYRRKFRAFDADNSNIDELNDELGRQTIEPEIILIKGSQRAGMTLPKPNFIRSRYENQSINIDTVAQSGPGRACGYGRLSDDYPIYCHLPHIDEAIAHYEELAQGRYTTVPRGTSNKGKRVKHKWPIKEWIHPPDVWKKVKAHPDFARFAHLKDKDKGGQGGRKVRLTCSNNRRNDYAELLLRGARDSGNPFGFYMDACITKQTLQSKISSLRKKDNWRPEMEAEIMAILPKRQASWARFVERYPDKVGCFAVLGDKPVIIEEVDGDDPRNALQRPFSALRRDGKPIERRTKPAMDPLAAAQLFKAWRAQFSHTGRVTSSELLILLRAERKPHALNKALKAAGIDVTNPIKLGLGLKRLEGTVKYGWMFGATGKDGYNKILWGLQRC